MKIFIADYLPLSNKGEEEILRGIETLFNKRGDEQISFSVFGDVSEMTKIGNVSVYPKNICYPDYSQKRKIKTLIGLWWALLGIFNIYPYKKNLSPHNKVFDDLRDSDTILIGHDGFYNIRCAMLGNYLYSKGLSYGILGAGFNKPGKKISWLYDRVYKKCFDNAEYIILREKTAYDYVKSLSSNKIVKLYPDPAFFCPFNSFNKENISELESKYRINENNVLKIGMTICEDSISFSRAFDGNPNKVEAHRSFIADLMSSLSKEYRCRFYFLPHCIKEGKGNDLIIAKNIKSQLNGYIDCEIIEEDMPVLDLKHIISEMDLMIGERTHSIINSIATTTPFVSLTCSADFRTHDIVGDGCGLPQQIYDMDNPDLTVLLVLTKKTIEMGSELKKKLQEIRKQHESMKINFQEII